MAKAGGWERLSELSQLLQFFRRIYVHGEAENDHPAFRAWRQELVDFFKVLLLSCGVAERAEEGNPWVHFRFEAFCSVLTHSCCDWSSTDAFGCGLMSEVVSALLQVQSELPVCTPAIVHVLLHRLASLRPGKEAKGLFGALVSGIQDALDACPAMPGAALEASIEDCLRRPSPSAKWSLLATSMFVRGVLSLVSRSPRSLSRAVVPVLIRFMSERECGVNDRGLRPSSDVLDAENGAVCGLPCVSCAVAGASSRDATGPSNAEPRRRRCEAHEKRDIVLEGMLRWAVDAHFRRCSRLLQASLHRAVCEGVRQALDASAVGTGSTSPPPFPLACRMLLSFVGGLAGDGGTQIASCLRESCGTELRRFLAAHVESKSTVRPARGKRRNPTGMGEISLPVLNGYVGHLCLCRHVADATAASHLLWLSRQAVAAFRLLDGSVAPGFADQHGALLLRALSHALALLLTRPNRGTGSSATVVPDGAGNLLEILFDSDARPLAGLPRPLAEAAIDVLQRSGYLQLSRAEALIGAAPSRVPRQALKAGAVNASASLGGSSPDGVEFPMAASAFQRGWSLAAAGIDARLPLITHRSTLETADGGDSTDGEDDAASQGGDSVEACEDAPTDGNGWGHVPDEVALRVFSFMTAKRVCRLACVDRAWRELVDAERVWKPFFEARWPLSVLESDDDLAGVSDKLLEASCSSGEIKRKARRRKSHVVYWRFVEDNGSAPPTRNWMTLYRDRHRAERAARGRSVRKTKFPWLVCPYLGCVSSLKSEAAVKRHVHTHKRPPEKRRRTRKTSRSPEKDETPPSPRRRKTAAPLQTGTVI